MPNMSDSVGGGSTLCEVANILGTYIRCSLYVMWAGCCKEPKVRKLQREDGKH